MSDATPLSRVRAKTRSDDRSRETIQVMVEEKVSPSLLPVHWTEAQYQVSS